MHTKSLSKSELTGKVEMGGKTGSLSLTACKLERIPDSVVALLGEGRLRKLDMSHNVLRVVPEGLLGSTLRNLNLGHCGLASLPPLSGLISLATLCVDSNRLEALPPLPPSLETLSANHNGFAAVPSSVLVCARLKTLDLSFNAIVVLPGEITQLSVLEELLLDHNHVDTLASVGDFSLMRNLQILSLTFNRLSASPDTIPASLFLGTRLHRFQVDGNPAITNQTQLQVLPGFDAYLARRKESVDKRL